METHHGRDDDAGRVGRYSHFRKGTIEGSIYWTPTTGAWAVYGSITYSASTGALTVRPK
ncbi:hypothetical protein [Archangium sp. Cb G35]|uniref:hypothetical protein n=1 Tax=Archangium sp. Cb G35 TaxID=1920190 RepID=UPI0009F9FB7E|nr:hypothetical protein [Archangium sp. Cb G35]